MQSLFEQFMSPCKFTHYVNQRDAAHPPHWHLEIEMTYIEEGRTEYEVNEQKYLLKPGDLVVCPSASIHSTKGFVGNVSDIIIFSMDLPQKFNLAPDGVDLYISAQKQKELGVDDTIAQAIQSMKPIKKDKTLSGLHYSVLLQMEVLKI